MTDLTTTDVGVRLRCHPQTIARHALRLGIGVNLGGRAGYRFTEADVSELREALRPKPITKQRKRTRRAA